eukprot:Hpha_TRINITY_DN8417_c0_g1::TRINITY_DN8417_c0_g1_i1::g.34749::m.34749
MPGWASIVKGRSTVRIHGVGHDDDTGKVVAHWETDYDVKDEGQTWYGTDVDISGLQMRGFIVFAAFTFSEDGKIAAITQRSDTVTKKLGVHEAVEAARQRAKDK